MADARQVIGKAVLRSSCAVSLAAPIFFAWASTIDLSPARGQFADWAPVARWCFIPFALYLLVAPFIWEFSRPLRDRLVAKTQGDERIILLVATSGATAVIGVTFVIVLFTGASSTEVRSWAAVSLLVAVFWCWWYRNLLA